MKCRSFCGCKCINSGEEPTERMAKLSEKEFHPGDIVWSRISGCSWWPVQVVDENCVACKAKKRKNNLVLVRVYGTFEHIYVEPSNCVSKIDNIFGQKECREVLQNSLNEDLALLKQVVPFNGRVFQLKENGTDEPLEGKRQRKGQLKRTLEEWKLALVDSSDNPKSARDYKVVMRNGMNAVVSPEDEIALQDGRENTKPKRRTRSKTFKAKNAGKSEIEMSNGSWKTLGGGSVIRQSRIRNKSYNSRHKDDKDEVTAWNHMNEGTQFGYSDVKSIKQLVTRIVKEVAAENARKQALKVEEEECSDNTKLIGNSRKGSFEIEQCPGDVKKRNCEVHITYGRIDALRPDKIGGQSDMQRPIVTEKVSNGGFLIKTTDDVELSKQDLEYCNDESAKCATIDASVLTEAKLAYTERKGTIGSYHYRLTRSKTRYQRNRLSKNTSRRFSKKRWANKANCSQVGKNWRTKR
ncbi:hypothetical protein HPP92_005652 [Vanilla planifolia]|uniref:PWWP domain-containing protein n=1 Tax=Vanilla planifolia TaxID=51239 RepID=A0A835RZ89_VANPL|nr:hypothetical protein HPP92_005652 [Vanilla planifolia]